MSEEEEDISSETTLSESSSDSEEDVIQDLPDKDFFKTLSCLKNRDPKIYDSSVQFFTQPPVVITNKNKQKSIGSSSENLVVDDKCDVLVHKSEDERYKPSNTKFSLKDLDDDSSSEDELLAFKQNSSETPKNENEDESEYIQFLKGRKTKLEDKEIEEELKPLQTFWNTESLDENEQFLKDYILNRKYLASDPGVNADNENLSEDERELEEQEEHEHNYNFRFENEENLKIKRFPRTVEGSLRRKNDARSKKRAELAKRKKEEKEKKYQEIKKRQKEKLSEIEERLQKLKELTGNVELGFKDEEILEDFDPEKHDQKMKELFNEDYYNEEDNEYPFPNDDMNEWNNDEVDWEDENIDMDCDVEGVKTKKLTRSQKKKLRKKKTYQDIIDIAKPTFDPNVHSDFKKYFDEYYSLDCEDFIDDIPCKFKYREVVPNDYGLSVEEILAADDKELNRWASVKKICKRRPEHVERNEVKIYKMKARDDSLKKAILKSLYTPPEEQQDQFKKNRESSKIESNDHLENMDETSDNNAIEDLSESVKTASENNGLNKNKKRKKSNNSKDLSTSLESSQDDLNIKKIKSDISPCKSQLVVESSENDSCPGTTDSINTDNGGVSKHESNEESPQKKKRRKRRKKKKQPNESSTAENMVKNNDTNQTKSTDNNETPTPQINGKNAAKKKKKSKNNKKKMLNNKLAGKFGVKKKKNENNIVNLSDSRLMAYGIKPKQFRSKVKYSTKSV